MTPDRNPVAAARWGWTARALLVGAALLVFAQALANGFVNYDDQSVLLGQPFLRSLTGENLVRCFSPFDVREEWLPLRDLSYMLNFALLGRRPGAFVFVNLLLHAGVVLLVHRLGLRVMTLLEAPRPRLLAFLGALAFAVHPIHLESVVWISGRKDSLCAIFYLLSVDAYLDHVRGRPGLVRALLWGGCAFLSKASAMSLPLVFAAAEVLLAERGRPWRARVLGVLPMAVLTAGFVAGYSAMLRRFSASTGTDVLKAPPIDAFWKIPLTDLSLVRLYLQRLVLPVDQQVFGYERYRTAVTAEVALSGAVCVLALAGAVWLARRRPAAGFLALWVLLALVPFLNLAPTGILYAERYLHLSSIGACLLLPWLLWRLGAALGQPRVLPLVLVPLLVFYTWRASRLTRVFRDGATLWAHVVRTQPRNPIGYWGLGNYHFGDDPNWPGQVHDPRVAELAFRESVRLGPDFPTTLVLLGRARAAQGDLRGGLAAVCSALAVDPGNGQARLTEGELLGRLGRFDEALARFDALLAERPERAARAAFLRALTLDAAGRRAEARAAWEGYLEAYGAVPGEEAHYAEAQRRVGAR